MKKSMRLAVCLAASLLTAPLLATTYETPHASYSESSPPQSVTLTWVFSTRDFAGVTCAVIEGVYERTPGGSQGKPVGSIAVPDILYLSDGTGYVVKELSPTAFKDQVALTDVTLSTTVQAVRPGAFDGCTVLASLSVANGNPWFAAKDGLLYDKDLETLVRCPLTAEAVTLPESLTALAEGAFGGCFRLKALDVPEGVRAIGAHAFKGCSALRDVYFSSSDAPTCGTDIYEDAVPDLVSHVVEGTAWAAALVPGATWNGRAVTVDSTVTPGRPVTLFSGKVFWTLVVNDGNATLVGVNGKASVPTTVRETFTPGPLTSGDPEDSAIDKWIPDGRLVIPATIKGYPITGIGSNAFRNCRALATVVIPDSVTSIGDHAFQNCESITELELPSTVKSLGYRPFEGMGIETLALPNGLRRTDGNPGAGCETLLSFSISPQHSYFAASGGVLYDKDLETLVGCPSRMEAVTPPASLRRIGEEAFCGCFRLKALTFPSGLAAIGRDAFADCVRLCALTFTGDAPACPDDVFAKARADLVSYARPDASDWGPLPGTWKGRAIKPLSPGGPSTPVQPPAVGETFVLVTTNDAEVAWELKRLENDGVAILGRLPKPVDAFTVPGRFTSDWGDFIVTELGDGAFGNALGLTSVETPASLVALGDHVFSNCTALASVTLNHSLRSLGKAPFCGTPLETVALPDTVEAIDGNPFVGCRPSVSITVGANNPFFSSTSEGALYDKDFRRLVACPMVVETLAVPASVLEIADDAFAGCLRLSTVSFAGNAPTCADEVYASTPAGLLSRVNPSSTGWGVEIPGTWKGRAIAYEGTAAPVPPGGVLTDGTWYYTLNADGFAVLGHDGGTALVNPKTHGSVDVPETVDGIPVVALGDGALSNCTQVTAVTLPNTLEEIGANAFFGTKVAELTIPKYVKRIGGNPAAGCPYLEKIVVSPGNIDFASTASGELYDAGFTTLLAVPPRATAITLPASLRRIGNAALDGCTRLTAVTALCDEPAASDTVFRDTPAALTTSADAVSTSWPGATDGTWKGRPFVNAHVDPEGAFDVTDENGTTWTYVVRNGKATVTGIADPTPVLTVPTAVGGYPVGDIAPGALAGLTNVSSFVSHAAAFTARDGVLYSADGTRLVRVPGRMALPGQMTETTLDLTWSQVSFSQSVTTTVTTNGAAVTAETPIVGDVTLESLLANVEVIGEYAFAGCNNWGRSVVVVTNGEITTTSEVTPSGAARTTLSCSLTVRETDCTTPIALPASVMCVMLPTATNDSSVVFAGPVPTQPVPGVAYAVAALSATEASKKLRALMKLADKAPPGVDGAVYESYFAYPAAPLAGRPGHYTVTAELNPAAIGFATADAEVAAAVAAVAAGLADRVSVSTRPGLYYAIAGTDDLSRPYAVIDCRYASGEKTELLMTRPSDTSGYFKLLVSSSPIASAE